LGFCSAVFTATAALSLSTTATPALTLAGTLTAAPAALTLRSSRLVVLAAGTLSSA
jgi:hypothetical protein